MQALEIETSCLNGTMGAFEFASESLAARRVVLSPSLSVAYLLKSPTWTCAYRLTTHSFAIERHAAQQRKSSAPCPSSIALSVAVAGSASDAKRNPKDAIKARMIRYSPRDVEIAPRANRHVPWHTLSRPCVALEARHPA
jgi:hypothetical protein